VARTGPRPKKGLSFPTRTAEEPGQTLNVDLCFVPTSHRAAAHLPAVSGSSGRLVVASSPTPAPAPPRHPGQVFADPTQPYADAMHAFIAASPPRLAHLPSAPPDPARQDARQQRLRLRQEAETLRVQRRAVRLQRQREDATWRRLRQQQCGQPPDPTPPLPEAAWHALVQQRHATLRQREGEDVAWRRARQQLRAAAQPSVPPRTWLAILVVTDNCTRHCLALPLFTAGAAVTAEQVSAALAACLPPDLEFVISDRGTHFTASAFAQLATAAAFVHVVIARHRPQSNGIAERFVQTLKRWLTDHSWEDADALSPLLAQFRADYNDRPHQGLGIPGLSPNEFANRIWLL
jgi:transposase InsO family protein